MNQNKLGRIDRLRNRYFGVRRKIVRYSVQKNAGLMVYWKTVEEGRGPAAALSVLGKEVLRYDCFGPGGHFHTHPGDLPDVEKERRPLPEPTVSGQIDYAAKDMPLNAQRYLAESRDAAIRDFKLDPAAMEKAAAWMKIKLLQRAGR